MPAGIKDWAHEVAYAVDCGFNAVVGGYASEPFSARCYRCRDDGPIISTCRKLLDAVLGHEHCQGSYEWMPMKAHYPPELR